MQVEVLQNAPRGAFCNTFDLQGEHSAILLTCINILLGLIVRKGQGDNLAESWLDAECSLLSHCGRDCDLKTAVPRNFSRMEPAMMSL